MEDAITASYVLNSSAMAKGVKWSCRRSAWRQIFDIVFVAVAVLSLAMIAHKLNSGSNRRIGIEVILLCSAIGGLIGRFVEVRRCLKSIDSSPAAGRSVEFQFDEGGFTTRTPGTESKVIWASLLDTYATPDGCLLYPQRGLFIWLPPDAFESEADYSRFLHLIAANTKHSKLG